jgi:uncharacterized protein (TIGR00251 family)
MIPPNEQESRPSFTLEIRAVPNAPKSAVAGWHGTALRIRLKAPALEGRANAELIEFLARALGVPRRDLALIVGEKSRTKTVRVAGLDRENALRRLGC